MPRASRRRAVAALALFGLVVVVGLVIALSAASRVPLNAPDGVGLAGAIAAALAPPTPSPTPTLAPTKFAIVVPSSTPSPTASLTPTLSPTPSPTPTVRPTRRPPTPTRVPSPSPTPLPPTATPVLVGETYSTMSVHPDPSDHSTALSELSLAARGVAPAADTLGLIDANGPFDAGAPQLYGLFSDERTPEFSAVYQILDWNWDCDCAGAPLAEPEVTAVGLDADAGELVRVPHSSYYIGQDFQALVLFADENGITFDYTLSGNPVRGYAIYLQGVAVDSTLLALYRQSNASGRAQLPALKPGQAIGRAIGGEVTLAIRDAGAFMDPRIRKDWWRGR